MFPFLCPKVFQPQTRSVLAEAGLGGVGEGLKDLEAGPNQEEKDVGESQQRAVRQLWLERWLVQQLLQLQLMLLMATVFLKVSEYCSILVVPSVC